MLIGNPMIFRQYPFEEALRLMVKFGYQALELWPPQIEMFKTDALRAQLAEHAADLGLPLVRLNAAGADYFIPLRSRQDSSQILAGLCQDIDIAAALGMRQVLTWEGQRPPGAASHDIHGWILDETVRILYEAADYAGKQGVSLTVEVHPFTLGINPDFLLKLCERVDSQDFGVTYDCCHFGVGLPDGYIDAISTLGSRIKHVHFSDSDKRSSELHFAPGTGCLDLAGIVAALKAIDYRGTMMLDLWLYPLPESGSAIGVPYLRRVMNTLGLSTR